MATKQELESLFEELESIVLNNVPTATGIAKYGGFVYTIKPEEKESQFCGIFPYKKYVQLSFSNGMALDDPDNILSGTGKYRRHVNFANVAEINTTYLKKLILQASRQ